MARTPFHRFSLLLFSSTRLVLYVRVHSYTGFGAAEADILSCVGVAVFY